MLILGHGKQQELLIVLDHLSLSFLMTLLIEIVDPRWWLMAQLLAAKTSAPCPLQEFNGEGPLCLFAVAYHLSLSLCLSICICNETTSELTEGAAAAFTDQHNQSRHCKWLANLCIRCIFCTGAMQLYWLGCNLRLSGFLSREPDESGPCCGHLRSFIACLCEKSCTS